MIVLDASVLIAAFDARDAYHDQARAILQQHSSAGFGCSPITRAETLVGPARHGRIEEFEARLDAMGVISVPLGGDAAARLARLRVTTGAKLPDCCVLLAAQQTTAAVAAFDDRLLTAATSLGLAVVEHGAGGAG